MRVLWITGNFQPEIGGLQVYVDRLTDRLSRHCEVGLITDARHAPSDNRAIAHFPVANITTPAQPDDWRKAGEDIQSAIAQFAPDIVHFANANVAVYRPVIGRSLPVLATIHGNDLTAPWQHTPGQDASSLILEGLDACDRIIAVSHHTAKLVRRWGVIAPMTVLHSGCDLDFFRPAAGQSDEVRDHYGVAPALPILLTVGRLVPRKGHLLIVEALRLLPSPVHWLVVGAGPFEHRLVEAVKEAGIASRVSFTGEVSNWALRSLYQACDAFVLTPEELRLGERYDSEGFGLVFLEAGACAKPVIASDVAGCGEAVIDGTTGLLVPPGDPQALADTIESLLADAERAASLGEGGLVSVRASGGWSRPARQTAQLYDEIIADARSEQGLLRLYRI